MGADFTPVINPYTGQGKFRFWCQKVLPLVYDDSLSYYELLCKVVEYLNNAISDVATTEGNVQNLYTAFSSLQDYVNTYFENLDVEEAVKHNVQNDFNAFVASDTFINLVDNFVENYVEQNIGTTVGEQIGTEVDRAVGEQIGGTVANQLPAVVSPIIPSAVTAWLVANVNPVGSAVTVDSSLTIEGSAADAKATGDSMGKIYEWFSGFDNEAITVDRRIGGISSSTGGNTSANNRVSTYAIDGATDFFIIHSTYDIKACAFAYYRLPAESSQYIQQEQQFERIHNGYIILKVKHGCAYKILIGLNDDSEVDESIKNEPIIKSFCLPRSNNIYNATVGNMSDIIKLNGTAIKWHGGTITDSGSYSNNDYSMRSDLIPITEGNVIKYTGVSEEGRVAFACYFNNDTFIRRDDIISESIVPIGANKVAFVYGRSSSTGVKNRNANELINDFDIEIIKYGYIHDRYENIGMKNVVRNAYQMSKLTYTLLANLPTQINTSTFPEYIASGTVIAGVPYSSVRTRSDYVPNCVSFQSFMTSILNTNSWLYTKENSEYNSKTYFGDFCSSMVAYCYGIDNVIPTTISFDTLDGMELIEDQSVYGIKIGDSLNLAGQHIVIITDIVRDKFGIIRGIEVTEQVNASNHPWTRRRMLTAERVTSDYFGNHYKAYRYRYLYTVKYNKTPWVNIDDETDIPVYSTVIMPARGDRSNWYEDEDITILYNNLNNYTGITITDGTTSQVVNIESGEGSISVTLGKGNYTAYMSGNGDSDTCEFGVITATATATRQGNYVRFAFVSRDGEVPSSVAICEGNPDDTDYRAVVAFHVLTNEEITAGHFEMEWTQTGTWLGRVFYKTDNGLFASRLVNIG